MKKIFLLLAAVSLAGCVSTKSTLKNVDDNAPNLQLKDNAFVIDQVSTDPKYGYDPDYPINLFYLNTRSEDKNPKRFFEALAGPNGEKLFYSRVDTCCPFPSDKTEMGAGLLDVYEVRWVGIKRPVRLYINIYSKGVLMAPMGFTIKNSSNTTKP